MTAAWVVSHLPLCHFAECLSLPGSLMKFRRLRLYRPLCSIHFETFCLCTWHCMILLLMIGACELDREGTYSHVCVYGHV
jgi:hypothetical protein